MFDFLYSKPLFLFLFLDLVFELKKGLLSLILNTIDMSMWNGSAHEVIHTMFGPTEASFSDCLLRVWTVVSLFWPFDILYYLCRILQPTVFLGLLSLRQANLLTP